MKCWVTMMFVALIGVAAVFAAPVQLVDEAPVQIYQIEEGVYMVDFGRVAFGNIRLMPTVNATGTVVLHFGEAFADGRVNRNPPGTVRYQRCAVTLSGTNTVVAAPAADRRNTNVESRPPAILTPPEWGVVLPFRWVELEGWSGPLRPEHLVRQAAFAATWNDEAATFSSSDEMVNKIWELCRYSIKATTFAGLYVDGDRERIPYEADAYLNQLSHYYTDDDVQMARDTFDHLMEHPTWPTEWAPHMIFMAHADWMQTGDRDWLKSRYESLKKKALIERRNGEGLVTSSDAQIRRDDIVDWPQGERDGYVFTPVNTVVNAFHIRALQLMAELARALGKEEDEALYSTMAAGSLTAFQQQLFDVDQGLFRDGVDTGHQSLHANLFPLAFGLVPEADRVRVARWLADRGMRCSVYAAQYLMEGLFEHGDAHEALALMTAPNDRSWRHMVESGTTITWEAWDQKYKPNQDWNHAWGAAPANLLPRYVLGVQAQSPGWASARISPRIGGLAFAKGKVPTPKGAVFVHWENRDRFKMSLTLPEGMTALVDLPAEHGTNGVFSSGKKMAASRVAGRWVLSQPLSGVVELEVR
jgi:alpha-L-rhamnosidase